MEHKTWLRRKKSSEKTTVSNNKLALALLTIEEEVQSYPEEKGNEAERTGKNLNEKLASVLLDCHVKEEAISEESVPKQELDEALRQGIAANERLAHQEDELKECMKQLNCVREEQEQKIHNAVMTTSKEYGEAQKKLEEKLREAYEQLTKLAVENTNMTRALRVKEKSMEELHRHKSQRDAEFSALMARVDSTEKENAFLRYEFHMLEKELEIRSEEMEYNRRSAEESHKQHLESVGKITELEQECQRLHLLVRKRMPGPTSLVNMKNEGKLLRRNQTETRRRKLNPTRDMIVRDPAIANLPEIPNKTMTFMIEQLRNMEEENKVLRDILTRKNSELLSSRNMQSRTASRLELARCGHIPDDVSRYSRFDMSSDDGLSSSESWAGALLSELEHFRSGRLKSPQKHREIEVSDMSLMDDFVEMEKLAIVSSDTPPVNAHNLRVTSKDLVPVEVHSSSSDGRKYGQLKKVSPENSFDWLQIVLKAILEEKNGSKRSLDELFEDIKIALGYLNQPTKHEDYKTAESQEKTLCLPPVASPNDQDVWFGLNKVVDQLQEDKIRLEDELKNMESAKKEMEARLHSETEKSEALMAQLEESRESLGSLQTELENVKGSEEMEDQLEHQKSINEDLETQLTILKTKLKEAFQKFSSLEVELEDKHNCFEELEATCLELQLQQESAAKTETHKYGISKEEKQSQPGWEITTASVKLAECQETILNLGKQLKALATPREAELFDKVFSNPSSAANATNNNQQKRSSLHDQMLAEHSPRASTKDKETTKDADGQKPSFVHSDSQNALSTPSALVHSQQGQFGSKHLAIVPSKKQGGFSFLRRLMQRRKKGSSKKPQSLPKA